MAIIIKKRQLGQVRTPAPLVEDKPSTQPREQTAPTKLKIGKQAQPSPHIPYDERPIAKTLQELWDNPNTLRAPESRECALCGRAYAFPCDGQNPKCSNARWVRERQK